MTAAPVETAPAVAKPNLSQEMKIKADELARSGHLLDIRAAQSAVAKTQWGSNLRPEEVAAFEHQLSRLGLTFAAGHANVLGGNLYVNVEGRLAHANATGEFLGFVRDEPLPRDQWEAWGVPKDADCAWISAADRAGRHPQVEVGWAGGSKESNPVAKKYPGELSRKRSRARSLKYCFPLGLPSEEESVLDVDYQEVVSEKMGLKPPTRKAAPAAVEAPPQTVQQATPAAEAETVRTVQLEPQEDKGVTNSVEAMKERAFADFSDAAKKAGIAGEKLRTIIDECSDDTTVYRDMIEDRIANGGN